MSTDAHDPDLATLDLIPDAVMLWRAGTVVWKNRMLRRLTAGANRPSFEIGELEWPKAGHDLDGAPVPLTIAAGGQSHSFEATSCLISAEPEPTWLIVARPVPDRKATTQAQRALSRFIVSATTLTHPSNERSHDIELELGRLVGDYAEYFGLDRVELLDSSARLALSVEDSMVELDQYGSNGIWAEATELGFLSAHRLLVGNRTGEMHLFFRTPGRSIELLDTHSLFAEVLLSALHNGREVGRLRFAAAHDALTGLVNRVGFRVGLERQLGLGQCSVLFLDLDGFKAINDELGHQIGDAVLAETARRLKHELRPGDLAARLGGDEFAIVVATTVPAHLDALADRLAAAIAEPMNVGPYGVEVGASVGVASHRAEESIDDLMAAADQAMYAVKASRPRDKYPPMQPEQ